MISAKAFEILGCVISARKKRKGLFSDKMGEGYKVI